MGHIADIIKCDGYNGTFIWKHPCEDFNSTTQLIVHESQEAIFFMNGQALDSFGPGRHTLETQNIPLLGRFFNKLTGSKETPFHCEVYFINKTVQMAIKWGTDSKVRFLDPTLGFPIELGACGELNLEVSDSRKLLVKLVGTSNGIAWGDSINFAKSLMNSFKPLISTAVKTQLSSAIKEQNINVLEVDEKLDVLSEGLRKKMLPGFEEYGLTIPQLYITNVLLPEHDQNFRKMRELHALSLQTRMIQAETLIKTAQAESAATVTAAQRKVEMEKQTTETEIARREAERTIIEAQAKAEADKIKGFSEAQVMAAQGYNKKDVLSAEVQKAYAEGIGNMTVTGGGGGVVGDMVGLGVGMAAAGSIAPQLGEMLKGFSSPSSAPTSAEAVEKKSVKCAKCGADLPENAKFCLECGEKVQSPIPDGLIVCPKCGNTVAKGKFCPECGHKFISACPKCATEVAPGAKFCPECGEKL